eukprot:217564_1
MGNTQSFLSTQRGYNKYYNAQSINHSLLHPTKASITKPPMHIRLYGINEAILTVSENVVVTLEYIRTLFIGMSYLDAVGALTILTEIMSNVCRYTAINIQNLEGICQKHYNMIFKILCYNGWTPDQMNTTLCFTSGCRMDICGIVTITNFYYKQLQTNPSNVDILTNIFMFEVIDIEELNNICSNPAKHNDICIESRDIHSNMNDMQNNTNANNDVQMNNENDDDNFIETLPGMLNCIGSHLTSDNSKQIKPQIK